MASFGSSDGPQLTFGAAAASAEGGQPLSFGAVGTAVDPPKVEQFGASFGDAPEATTEPKTEGDEDTVKEAESTAEFVPVVQLDEVDVKTHEEEEEVTYKQRAKLFRYTETLLNKGSGKKEWIERGVGEIKLLKHRESSKTRVLMRQEKTMKVIANHVVDPRIELTPSAGSDRSWVWSVFDFSDGDLVEEVFAIRFGNAENANEFKETFSAVQKEMEKICAGGDAGPDAAADEAADALTSLSTTEAPAAADPAAEPAVEAPADP